MKKLNLSDFTTKYAILTEVFALIYFSLGVIGFGVNGELSPSGPMMAAILISGICFVSFGTKMLTEYENKHNPK